MFFIAVVGRLVRHPPSLFFGVDRENAIICIIHEIKRMGKGARQEETGRQTESVTLSGDDKQTDARPSDILSTRVAGKKTVVNNVAWHERGCASRFFLFCLTPCCKLMMLKQKNGLKNSATNCAQETPQTC